MKFRLVVHGAMYTEIDAESPQEAMLEALQGGGYVKRKIEFIPDPGQYIVLAELPETPEEPVTALPPSFTGALDDYRERNC